MATYWLLNNLFFPLPPGQGREWKAGTLVDSSVTPLAPLMGAGATLWPSADPLVTAAAGLVAKQRGARGGDEASCESIMFAAALMSLQVGQIGGGIATVWAGEFAVASTCYWLDLSSADVTLNLDAVPSPVSGLAFLYDTQGAHTVKVTSTDTIQAAGTNGTYVTEFDFQPMGGSFIIKRNPAGKWNIQ